MGRTRTSDITCAIISGGQATRMRPLTEHTPKALLPVRGVPLLDRQLEWLRTQGVSRIVACLGHLAEPIESHLANVSAKFDARIIVSTEGESALGTAGAIRLAIERGLLGQRFVTLYGDVIPSFGLGAALERWKTSAAAALLCVYPAPKGGEDARAIVRDGRVASFSRYPSPSERTMMTHGDYGVAGFHASQFAHLAPWTRGGFGTIHAELARAGQLAAYEVDSPPTEVGNLEAYSRAQVSSDWPTVSADGNSTSNR